MFKFLKDKLKGALSTFSKKAEETATEEIAEPEEKIVREERVEEKPVAQERRASRKKKTEKKEPAQEEPETKKEHAEPQAIATEEAPDATPAEEPEKKGFFSKVKGFFSKKEEVEELADHIEKPVEVAEPEDVIVEEAEIAVEGSPLRKVRIHDHIESEQPIVDKVFEPIEPEQPKIVKQELPAEEYTPQKIQERIKEELEEAQGEKEAPAPKITRVERLKPKAVIEEKKGFFSRIKEAVTTKKISETQFEELFWDIEVALLENNVAVEVITKIKDDLKTALVDKPIPRGNVEATIMTTLKATLQELFDVPTIDVLTESTKKKPYIICFVGINGSGKTTTIAKFTHMLQKQGKSVVLAAADTFRAAAIDQLQLHADKLNVKLIKQDYGSDPAAVAFDAIKHAEATHKDIVLIDTAGRLHSNINLVDEMKKIVRVAKPDCILFIGESITGNDCVEQAKQFNDAVGINGIILSKADIDEKGGAAISVSYVTKKPILYLGTGQEYDDLKPFDANAMIESLGL